MMNEKICCFSGHRSIMDEDYINVLEGLFDGIREMIKNGVRTFYAGGALGFDMLAETIVLKYKKEFPDVKLILLLPCKTQTKGWTNGNIELYEKIKTASDEVIYVSEEYSQGCMHKRNRALVDMSDYIICYLIKDTGGTAYTVEYAKEKNLQIINLAEYKRNK